MEFETTGRELRKLKEALCDISHLEGNEEREECFW
jgi:hypothetical protein